MRASRTLRSVILRQASAAALVLLLLIPAQIQASWNIVFSQPNGNIIRAGFFLNESTGIVGGPIEQGTYKTTDGGLTWSNTRLPPYPDGNLPAGFINQIRMTSALDGWLACDPTTPTNDKLYLPPAVYHTTDGGQSWQPTLALTLASDISVTPAAISVTSGNHVGIDLFGKVYGKGHSSFDGGITFIPALDTTVGISFVDDFHGVATGFIKHPWYRTTDGGKTWRSLTTSPDVESWGIYGVKGTSWFFTAGEGDDSLTSAYRSIPTFSSDDGANWNMLPTLPFRTTGHIAGVGFLLYVQADGDNGDKSGLWRSRDSGKTWTNVGGPTHTKDTRFVVLGCRGEVIYAFDDKGNVWKTTDGGDGSMPQFALEAKSIAVDSIDACRPRDTIVSIKNLGCDTIYITNTSTPATPPLTVLDPATGTAPTYPITVLPNSNASLMLQLGAPSIGAYQSYVVLDLDREGVLSYDTLWVTSALKYSDPVKVLSNNLQYDSTSLCSSSDTVVTISDTGCFGVYIVNSQLKIGTNFILDSTRAGDSLAAFSNISFPIRFAPTGKGRSSDSLIVNLLVMDRPIRVSIPISGTAKSNNPLLVMADRFGDTLPNVINFDTMTRCQDSIFAFTVRESGCDSLYVSLEWFDSTMTNPPPRSEFKWSSLAPSWLKQDGKPIVAGLEVIPTSAQGSYKGYLQITDSIKGTASKVVQTIPYRVFIIPGSRILSIDSSVRNFDTIAFCDSKDTAITISNQGCDTLHVTQLRLSNTNYFFSHPITTPFSILPYDSVIDTLYYVPTVSGLSSDTLTIRTGDSVITRIIPILGYATPTDTIRFSPVATVQTVKPGDTATVLIMPNGMFAGNGLSNIVVTLAYNSDVMTLYDPSGATTAIHGAGTPFFNSPLLIGGKVTYLPITISGTNLTFDSTTELLKLQFLISLSDSGWTDFRIASIQLNNGNMNFGKCALGGIADSATIVLRFVCGDSIMYNFLRGANWAPGAGIAPAVGNAHPNPVRSGEAVAIPFKALRSVNVRLEINDSKGALVYSGMEAIPNAGAEEFVVPAASLGSGAYHYTLEAVDTGRAEVSGDFIVTK